MVDPFTYLVAPNLLPEVQETAQRCQHALAVWIHVTFFFSIAADRRYTTQAFSKVR
jgi:hypothetical protein